MEATTILTRGGNPIGARKCDSFKAVSTAPSINKTPVGSSTPPLPYTTTQDLSNSVSTVPSVRLNGDPVFVLTQSTQPSCKGDDPGTAKGVKSGTVNGEVKPTKGSTTVRAGTKNVVRERDPCTMNGGNNPGIYVTTQAPSCSVQDSVPTKDTDPPVTAQTPQEEGWLRTWWDQTKTNLAAALEDPWEALKGGAKDFANIPSNLGDVFMKGSALQSAADMEQAAAWQSLFGQTESAQALTEAAQHVRSSVDGISLPKFEMSNPAQAGGATVATAASLLAGGAGLVKSGVKGAGVMGKAGAASGEGAGAAKGISTGAKALGPESRLSRGAQSADTLADAAKSAEAVQGGGTAAKSQGNGVKILPKTAHEKAAFGEAKAHERMVERGYEPVGKTDGSYAPGKQGIDGIYRNPSPPPDYIVTEVKFGTVQLEKGLADGTNQMDNKWVQDRLASKVGRVEAANISDAMKNGNVEKWLIRVSEDGSSYATKVNSVGSPIRGTAGKPPGF